MPPRKAHIPLDQSRLTKDGPSQSPYRVRNWHEYETSLRRRGDLTIWFSDDAIKSFSELRGKIGQRDDHAALGRTVAPDMDEFREFQVARKQAAAKEQEQEKAPAWSPPALPANWQHELAKPEGEQNPEVVRAVRANQQYKDEWWARMYDDPTAMVKELVSPAVEAEVGRRLSETREFDRVMAATKDDADFIETHADDIQAIMQRHGADLELATETLKSRLAAGVKAKGEKATEARKADEASLSQEVPESPEGVARPKELSGEKPSSISGGQVLARELGLPVNS